LQVKTTVRILAAAKSFSEYQRPSTPCRRNSGAFIPISKVLGGSSATASKAASNQNPAASVILFMSILI